MITAALTKRDEPDKAEWSLKQLDHVTGTVIIFGGDQLVGRSLAWSLTNAGYEARFHYEIPNPDGLLESLAGFRLVLLAPRIGAARRGALLDGIRSAGVTARLPVLELATMLDEAGTEREGVGLVAWPCSTEELMRHIEVALIDEHDSRNGNPKAQARPERRARVQI